MKNNSEEQLKSMLDEHTYDELVDKCHQHIADPIFDAVFPIICDKLVNGNGEEREKILNGWLDMDSVRVCTTCGKMMSEGWYLCDAGYACSDECAAKSEGITMEEFEKWRIYKDDIIEVLKYEGHGRKIEDLSKEECDKLIDKYIMPNAEYFWTEWY